MYVPAAVPTATDRLIVVDAPLAAAGLSVAVIPAGSPVTAKLTVPVNPPVRVMFAVRAPAPPTAIEVTLDVNATENPCAAVTVSVNGAVVVTPPVPVARKVIV